MTHQQLHKVSVVGVTVHWGPVLSHADVQSVNCGKPIDWWGKKKRTRLTLKTAAPRAIRLLPVSALRGDGPPSWMRELKGETVTSDNNGNNKLNSKKQKGKNNFMHCIISWLFFRIRSSTVYSRTTFTGVRSMMNVFVQTANQQLTHLLETSTAAAAASVCVCVCVKGTPD